MIRWYKYGQLVFLTSRNANKHVLLVLGVNHTARDATKAKFTAGFIHVPLLQGIVSPSLARHQVMV